MTSTRSRNKGQRSGPPAPTLKRITLLRDMIHDVAAYPFDISAIATLKILDVRARDEPEAALSAGRQLALLVRMHDLLRHDPRAQFIIASHSPILLAFPNAQIVSFDGPALHEIAYRETDAYNVTRRFLFDTDRMLAQLFASADAH